MASWSDIVPRFGTAYDLFGDGKTALKVSINKYVIAQGLQVTYGDTANPVNRLANIVTRTWTDQNRNFTPDCDLTNVLAQDLRAAGGDLCGVVSDTNFGKPTVSLNYDPAVLNGWGTRPYQWEFSASVQRQLTNNVSFDFGHSGGVWQLRRYGQPEPDRRGLHQLLASPPRSIRGCRTAAATSSARSTTSTPPR
jgi:hypothetical protein